MRIWKRSIIVAAIVGALCAPTFAMASQANSFGDMSFTGAQLTEFKARPHHPGPPPPPKTHKPGRPMPPPPPPRHHR